jgi:hypothetical protein
MGRPSLFSSSWSRSSVQWQVGGTAPPSGAGGTERALAMTRPRSCSVYVRGRPGRGASSSPASPAALNRLSHPRTTSAPTPTRPAIAGTRAPSAASATIHARRANRTGAVSARTSRPIFTCSSSVRSRTHTAMAHTSYGQRQQEPCPT